MAPGLGLYLDELYFEAYNTKIENEIKKTNNKQKQQQKANSDSSSNNNEDSNEDSVSRRGLFYFRSKNEMICMDVCVSMYMLF